MCIGSLGRTLLKQHLTGAGNSWVPGVDDTAAFLHYMNAQGQYWNSQDSKINVNCPVFNLDTPAND